MTSVKILPLYARFFTSHTHVLEVCDDNVCRFKNIIENLLAAKHHDNKRHDKTYIRVGCSMDFVMYNTFIR